jgi:hypothetical protein
MSGVFRKERAVSFNEKHFPVPELAEKWGASYRTVMRLLVPYVERGEILIIGRRKKHYGPVPKHPLRHRYLVPQSVAEKVYAEWCSAKGGSPTEPRKGKKPATPEMIQLPDERKIA